MILREVLSEGDGKGSLASVASTSKALYSGAIAVLWEDMERLDPFLDLIPEKVWDYVRAEEEPERVRRSAVLSMTQLMSSCIRPGDVSFTVTSLSSIASNGTANISSALHGVWKRVEGCRMSRRSGCSCTFPATFNSFRTCGPLPGPNMGHPIVQVFSTLGSSPTRVSRNSS